MALGWLLVPLVIIGVLIGLWLFVPSPIPTPAGSFAFESQSFPLKELEYLNSLKMDPTDVHLWFQLGQLYLDWAQQLEAGARVDEAGEKLRAAVDAFERSLSRDPRNALTRTALGTAYYFLGNIDEAVSQYVQATSYDPNYALAHFNLGFVLYNHARDLNGAARHFEALLELEPTGERSDYARQKLEEIKAARQTGNR